jgi:hypothetical protein
MRKVTRQHIASVLVSIFGSLAVWGYALHGLPGLNHFSRCSCVYHATSDWRLDLSTTGPGLRSGSPATTDHDCPICSFFALAKHVATPGPTIVVDGCVAILAAADYPNWFDATGSPYAARGPPRVGILFA